MVKILKESRKVYPRPRFGNFDYTVVMVEIEEGIYGTALNIYEDDGSTHIEKKQLWESKKRAEQDYEARKSFHVGR